MSQEYIEVANKNWGKISSAIGAGLAYLSGLELAGSDSNFWDILIDQPITIISGLVVAAVSAWRTGKQQGEQGAVSKAVDRVVANSVARQNGDEDFGD